MPKKPLDVTLKSTSPTVAEVTAADGKKYQIDFRVAVLEISDLMQPNPTNADLPLFEFKITVITDVKKA